VEFKKATQWYEKSILNSTTANVYTLTAIFNVGLIYKEGGDYSYLIIYF